MANFSKRHYEQVAAVIQYRRHLYEDCISAPRARDAVKEIQGDLCKLFAQDNPRFDAERFNKACEPKGEA